MIHPVIYTGPHTAAQVGLTRFNRGVPVGVADPGPVLSQPGFTKYKAGESKLAEKLPPILIRPPGDPRMFIASLGIIADIAAVHPAQPLHVIVTRKDDRAALLPLVLSPDRYQVCHTITRGVVRYGAEYQLILEPHSHLRDLLRKHTWENVVRRKFQLPCLGNSEAPTTLEKVQGTTPVILGVWPELESELRKVFPGIKSLSPTKGFTQVIAGLKRASYVIAAVESPYVILAAAMGIRVFQFGRAESDLVKHLLAYRHFGNDRVEFAPRPDHLGPDAVAAKLVPLINGQAVKRVERIQIPAQEVESGPGPTDRKARSRRRDHS